MLAGMAPTDTPGFLDWLRDLTLAEATAFFAAVNLVVFGASVTGNVLVRRGRAFQRISGRDQPVTRGDWGLSASTVGLNVVVSVVAWAAWTRGWLPLREETPWSLVLTALAFVFVMDAGLYLGHRLAHAAPLYRLFHWRHHVHRDTNALSLFVLHPLEVVGFGGLLVAAVAIVAPTPAALGAYLFFNVVFGTLGHADVRLLPAPLRRHSAVRWLGLDEFHLVHHHHEHANYGFYTRVWDRLFGTER